MLDGLLEALGTPRTPSPVLPGDRTQDELGRVLALGSRVFSGETIPSFNRNVSFPPLYNTGNKSQSPTPVTLSAMEITAIFISLDDVAESSKDYQFPSLLQNDVELLDLRSDHVI